ncbi:MAG: hypothetical protein ACREOJ_00120 [Gemmatimonadaceae bacterium]
MGIYAILTGKLGMVPQSWHRIGTSHVSTDWCTSGEHRAHVVSWSRSYSSVW